MAASHRAGATQGRELGNVRCWPHSAFGAARAATRRRAHHARRALRWLGLILLDGKPEFDYAFSNQLQHKYRVASNEKPAAGKHTIRFESKYDGPGMGKSATGTLMVDGKQVAQGKIERTIPLRFSLDETMDVGEDTGSPVVEDYLAKMPFKFTGDLKKFVIELGKSGLTASDTIKLEEANKKVAAVRD